MLHEKPVQYGPLADDGDETRAWTGEKRRKYLAPSSSDAPGTAQDHQDPISHVTDMHIIQGQDHELLLGSDLGQEDKDEQEEEELWGPGVDISEDEIISYAKCLATNIRPPVNTHCTMGQENFYEVRERLARYRITYYMIAKPESGCKLKHPAEYSPDDLYEELYFVRLEDDDSFEWNFHPDDSRKACLNDYQRLVVSDLARDSSHHEYLLWDEYRSCYNTYEIDAVYVKYYGELSKKIKWIEGYLELDRMSEEWRKVDDRAWNQALKIATRFPHMTVRLAGFAYDEFIGELRMDASLKDLDLVYFEIWKRVAKQKRSFRDALEEVYRMDKFHLHKSVMEAELKGRNVIYKMENLFKGFVLEGGIPENAEEDEARDLFRQIVYKELKPKNMAKYALKKMEIAERMGLVSRQA